LKVSHTNLAPHPNPNLAAHLNLAPPFFINSTPSTPAMLGGSVTVQVETIESFQAAGLVETNEGNS
jgi:hypothetical protein